VRGIDSFRVIYGGGRLSVFSYPRKLRARARNVS
jgi:hypothetical protein